LQFLPSLVVGAKLTIAINHWILRIIKEIQNILELEFCKLYFYS
jgi:hypothetical protein